ncbi:MAG TPA: hypothetical protein VKB88_30815 [Bryobacteraceae bacterium]|nr:hypothetical protein [Bryobacteraceae bacterium]
MTRTLCISAFAICALAAAAQTRQQKVVEELHAKQQTLQGILIDAGCEDRTLWNMERPAETQSAATAPGGQATRGAQATQSHGISVDSQTINAERQDITPVQETEMAARQSDPTCALKANTRGYAVLLPDGRLLDLDDGGNTYANAAVQSSRQGRAMLNGHGPGFKPRVTIVGRIEGSRVFTDSIKLH